MLKVGVTAPDFTATLDDGSAFELSNFRSEKNVVLYFYPKDFTAGCTAQACAFRDNYDPISRYDALIFGVSGDSERTHSSFKARHALPFPLITDPGREVHRLYEATGLIPWMTPRLTYVIDKAGVIRAAIRHDYRVQQHVPEVLEALRTLEVAQAS
jgi:thioredoxin-dependent peroxiredoxin